MTRDLRTLPPRTEQDYADIGAYIDQHRTIWVRQLVDGHHAVVARLTAAGFQPVVGHPAALAASQVLVESRLKATAAIIGKMRRFAEPLRAMLDVYGYRVVVAGPPMLDPAAGLLAEWWDTPRPEELLLRGGTLPFDWWRDYRARDHAGLSSATSDRYDEAVHLNRRAPFGVCELQVMTWGLYQRAVRSAGRDEAHDQFADRRQQLYDHDRAT